MITHAKKAVEAQTVNAAMKLAKSSKAEKQAIDYSKKEHQKEIAKLKQERAKLNTSLKTLTKKAQAPKLKMPKAKQEAHHHHHNVIQVNPVPTMSVVDSALTGLFGHHRTLGHYSHPYKCCCAQTEIEQCEE